MNNQAAQTMPELPLAIASINSDGYWTTDDRRPDWKWPARQRVFSVDQMHQYARDYAAALSQPAGVPDGWRVSKPDRGRAGDSWEVYAPDGSGGVVSLYDIKDWVVRDLLDVLAAAPSASGGDGPELHPVTEDLIRRFSDALREKLSAAEKKYGYSDGWASPDWMDQCRRHLDQHVAKGDPRDVAAYCAFLWHHGEPTTKRDRATDRKRFPDDDFNAWLDAGISDAGHTVYDSLSSIEDAWQGWHGHVLSVMIDENPVFDDLAIDSITPGASVSEREWALVPRYITGPAIDYLAGFDMDSVGNNTGDAASECWAGLVNMLGREPPELKFSNPVFHAGTNLTVRRGLKWHCEEWATVQIGDTRLTVRLSCITHRFSWLTDHWLRDEHDPACRTVAGLLVEMQRVYPGFSENEEVTLVRFELPAIEQALSSPRQEGDSTAASTQGLRELASEWRRKVREHFGYGPSGQALLYCANELESLLTSPTTGADGGNDGR